MMSLIKSLCIFLFFFYPFELFAQIGTGCLIGTTASGTLYPDYEGNFLGRVYFSSNALPVNAPNCPRFRVFGTAGLSCRIGTVTTLFGNEYSYEKLTSPIGCPLDEQLMFLILISCLYARSHLSIKFRYG